MDGAPPPGLFDELHDYRDTHVLPVALDTVFRWLNDYDPVLLNCDESRLTADTRPIIEAQKVWNKNRNHDTMVYFLNIAWPFILRIMARQISPLIQTCVTRILADKATVARASKEYIR